MEKGSFRGSASSLAPTCLFSDHTDETESFEHLAQFLVGLKGGGESPRMSHTEAVSTRPVLFSAHS